MKIIKTNLNIYSIIVLAVGIFLTALGGFLSKTPASPFGGDQTRPRMITVTGQAEVFVVPDEVVLNIGVETRDRDLEDAVNENGEIVEAVLGLVSSYGIDPDDVQTDYFRINPRYDYSSGRLEYYKVQKTFVIKLRDLSVFEDLLQALLIAGVNQVRGIEFLTSDLRSHKDEARALALQAAQEKAVDMAAELGQKIGKPYWIQEIHDQLNSMFDDSMQTNVLVSDGSSSVDFRTTLVAGQISILAEVVVSFELK
jgi:uncharacterized protein YggE